MSPSLPAWVEKRDGRREAFDADKISQSIFAATEAVGEPNAFLARELADGVLHFLVQENDSNVPTTGQIAELVEKVVRELGQPALAQAFSERQRSATATAPDKIARAPVTITFTVDEAHNDVRYRCSETYCLHAVFTRDLVAAHESGILDLRDVTAPGLSAMVLEPPQPKQSMAAWKLGWSQIRDATERAAWLAVDSVERFVAAHGPDWLEGFVAAAQAYGNLVVLNLHVPTPPAWSGQIAAGPLFEDKNSPHDSILAEAADAIVDILALDTNDLCGINWHVQAADLEDSKLRAMLESFWARTRKLGQFTLHRARQPVRLARGLDRQHPAVLFGVGLSLREFLDHPGIDGDGAKMIAKLPSLVRMAVSAGAQRRNYLRRRDGDLSRGFLLDRARLLIEPWDLEEVVEAISGADYWQSKLALDTGRQLVQTLQDAAREAGRSAGLEVVVANFQGVEIYESLFKPDELASAWQAAGSLLEGMDGGVVYVRRAEPSLDAVWRHLRHALKSTGVSKVCFWG